MVIIIAILVMIKTTKNDSNQNHPPQSQFSMCGMGINSQSWLVYETVLPTFNELGKTHADNERFYAPAKIISNH